MSERKSTLIFCSFVLSVSLMAAAVTAFFMVNMNSRIQFHLIDALCSDIIERQPEAEQIVLAALKNSLSKTIDNFELSTDKNILISYGYSSSDLLLSIQKYIPMFVSAGFLTGIFILFASLYLQHRKIHMCIKSLTAYLERIDTGSTDLLMHSKDDEFSKLQDEIYKTVTMLYQTREEAIKSKENYAENLSNISHQLKSPITSISLSAQILMKKTAAAEENKDFKTANEYAIQILRQLDRLTRLEEALLLLSRIDAGTLTLEKAPVDVFTLLMLASDNLAELMTSLDVFPDISELGEMQIIADQEWTMEAVINIMKNCAEHSPSGAMVHCTYSENPLYTQILIWDEGPGIPEKDLPYIFERFYRGSSTEKGGIGIGLSLAKEIIEAQNGTLRVYNLPGKGACFEIHFYCH